LSEEIGLIYAETMLLSIQKLRITFDFSFARGSQQIILSEHISFWWWDFD